MVDVSFDVGGSVNHRQSGGKIELGVASDHIVIYIVDPDDFEGSKGTIERMVKYHQYAKELKAGFVPARKVPGEDLSVTAPESAK